jgi:UDP-N-acetylmuramate dehydrogenase
MSRDYAAFRMFENDVPLAPLTTLGIGGPAKFFLRAESVDDVREALGFAAAETLPLLVLAGGSNVLIPDDGFGGLVVHMDLRGITIESEDAESVIVNVAAGERWDDFVDFAVASGWAGVECLSGIPGSAGATPIQNVGAYGQDVSETIVRVEVLDRESGRVVDLTNAQCNFSYRSSIFKTAAKDRYVVVSVTFRLRPGGPATVRYPELRAYLDERAIELDDLGAVRAAVIAIRKRKGMVLDPNDPDTRSDGSFFTNPIVPAERVPDGAPHFPGDGGVKLSAAWLIEHAGFHKGFALGNVGISTKHTLAIVNRGGGTAAEVLELVRTIQDAVRERFGVELQPEPVFVR